jgi:ribonucleoside-diphosphate reductase alpha chain
MTRRRLPVDRDSITHRFRIGDCKGYFSVGLYPDGSPGELFLWISKEGSTLSGFANAFSIMVSLGLQYGVPVRDLCKKFIGMQFEPDGVTKNPEIPFAKSIPDYIFRWMEKRFP